VGEAKGDAFGLELGEELGKIERDRPNVGGRQQ